MKKRKNQFRSLLTFESNVGIAQNLKRYMMRIPLFKFSAILIGFLLVSDAWGQVPPPLQQRGGYSWDESGTGLYASVADNGCNNTNEVTFTVVFDNINPDGNTDYLVRFYKVPFDHLNSIVNFNNQYNYTINDILYPTNFDENELIEIHSSGIQMNVNTSDETFTYSHTTNITLNYAYFVRIDTRKNNLSSWKLGSTKSFNYANGFTPIAADLVPTNSIGSTTMPSLHGDQTVYDFSQLSSILFDGSGSSCENAYQVYIDKFDLDSWSELGQVGFQDWTPGWAGSINVSSLANITIEPGQIYKLRLAVGPIWAVKDVFFRTLPASVDCHLPSSFDSYTVTVHIKGGLSKDYEINQICDNVAFVLLDGSNSQNEMSYDVEISEVDNNMNPIGVLAVSTNNFGEAPAGINLSGIFSNAGGQFVSNKIYRAKLTVKNQEVSKYVYFTLVPCKSSLKVDELKQENVSIYPNPASKTCTITLEEASSGTIEICSAMGGVVQRISFEDQNKITSDLSDLSSGVYLVKINTSSGVTTKQLIKE